jgi:uncharacterized protein YjiS (DUF1127 family)
MSTLRHSLVSNFHLPALPDLAGAMRRATIAVVEHAQHRRELHQLLEMDDRALKDIGLTRSDALAFARGHQEPVVRRPVAQAPEPLRVTDETLRHYNSRAQQLRAKVVRDLATGVVGWLRRRPAARRTARGVS